MSQQQLMLIEATGIQHYLFGSNQLAQNIGASELVRQATEEWVDELAPEGSVVYRGGGNAMLVLENERAADDVAQRLTRRALDRARGLDLVVKRAPYDPDRDVLASLHQDLRRQLAHRKRDRVVSTPLPGISVTAACVYTGAPAVALDQDRRPVSIEVQHKLHAAGVGRARLAHQLEQVERAGFDFVYDLGDFGTRDESSYLAIIHADGNRMGERIVQVGGKYNRPEMNDGYKQALREFSYSVHQAADRALSATVDALLDAVDPKGNMIAGKVPIPRRASDHQRLLPFRPIVFGGDDITFVTEGRLGLAVAALYLRLFSEQVLSDREPAHARAGVAIVKSHYPFSRAYDMAEQLAASAKAFIKENAPDRRLTALDWHFAVSGLVLPLDQVRAREYAVPAGHLEMRPVRLNPADGDWRSWDNFTYILDALHREPWAGRRSKVKALRNPLRDGRDAVRQFLRLHQREKLTLPQVAGEPDMTQSGWHGSGRCGYWDAVEALDFYVPLEGGPAR